MPRCGCLQKLLYHGVPADLDSIRKGFSLGFRVLWVPLTIPCFFGLGESCNGLYRKRVLTYSNYGKKMKNCNDIFLVRIEYSLQV